MVETGSVNFVIFNPRRPKIYVVYGSNRPDKRVIRVGYGSGRSSSRVTLGSVMVGSGSVSYTHLTLPTKRIV